MSYQDHINAQLTAALESASDQIATLQAHANTVQAQRDTLRNEMAEACDKLAAAQTRIENLQVLLGRAKFHLDAILDAPNETARYAALVNAAALRIR